MKTQKVWIVLSLLMSCALAFTADLNEKKANPLPAGGGDPGKAYLQYIQAFESGDFATLKKRMTAEEAKTIDTPEFKLMYPTMKALHTKEIKIDGGRSDGKVAILYAVGKDPNGKNSKGTLTLLMEDKEWKVQDDAWATDLNQ
jgi:hypothetical protein